MEKYCKIMNEYIAKGHARKVPDDQIDPGGKPLWYLPHHPVIHEYKPGKVRVVFDCATRFGDTSLNDQLLQGPDLTNNLTSVLLRFRQESVPLMVDVEQMFHQVRVALDDCHALQFLWWEDGDLSKNPVDHQMLVHLFGVTSPCYASFALKKPSKDFGNDFDAQTVDTVNRNFYVDDCLKSVVTVPEASKLANQLVQLLAKGGFYLTKWISNSREVLGEIPSSERAPSIANLDLEDLPIDRALATQWDVEADTLSFRVKEKPVPDTTRGILSLTSSLYDPLGFAAPLILPAKVLLQELCRLDFGWDETVPNETLVKWRAWLDDLPNLKLLSWPRCLKPKDDFGMLHNIQLHHFSDASEVGYGAASYLRLVNDQGRIHCGLIMAKSRVAPLKTITVPRMELTAAVVSVKLHKFITEQLDLLINKTVFWTDSTLVLQYIRNEARRFHTFVTN